MAGISYFYFQIWGGGVGQAEISFHSQRNAHRPYTALHRIKSAKLTNRVS